MSPPAVVDAPGHGAARPRRPGRPDAGGVRPRGHGRRRRRPAVAGLPPGRSRPRVAAPDAGSRSPRRGWSGPWSTSGCCCSTSAAPACPRPTASAPGPTRSTRRPRRRTSPHFRADAIVRDAECLRAHLGRRRAGRCSASPSAGSACCTTARASPTACARPTSPAGCRRSGRPPDRGVRRDARRAAPARGRPPPPPPRGRRPAAARCSTSPRPGGLRRTDGSPLTPRLVRTVGNQLGLHGGSAALHHLLERDPRSPAFVPDLEALLPFGGRNPLYAVVHESCYADGGVTGWAAERTLPDEDHLTGEHVFPWHFDDDPALVPYAATARLLAAHAWPRLYDADALAPSTCRARRRSTSTTRSSSAVQRGDAGAAAGRAPLGHRRLPAQRAARRRPADPRPADRAGARRGRTAPLRPTESGSSDWPVGPTWMSVPSSGHTPQS